MNNERTASFPYTPGGPILLCVFLSLCLFTLAVISLSISKHEYTEALMHFESIEHTEAARNLAQETLMTYNGTETNVSFAVPIDENRTLLVSAEKDADGTYRPVEYRTVYEGEWTPDETIPVLIPGEEN